MPCLSPPPRSLHGDPLREQPEPMILFAFGGQNAADPEQIRRQLAEQRTAIIPLPPSVARVSLA